MPALTKQSTLNFTEQDSSPFSKVLTQNQDKIKIKILAREIPTVTLQALQT